MASANDINEGNSNVVVTIGRSFGSGGREIGHKLADRIGAKYYDKELLREAARAAGVGEEFFERSDEKFPSYINGIFSFAFGYNSTNYYSGSTTISDDSIYRAQSDFIHSLAQGPDSCVVVGRTADYILRDHPRCVNVFVHAPEDVCVDRILSRGDCQECASREKVKAKARRINKLRANYYNFYTDKEWGKAGSYDLCFDTSKMPVDDIVEVIATYIERRFGSKDMKG